MAVADIQPAGVTTTATVVLIVVAVVVTVTVVLAVLAAATGHTWRISRAVVDYLRPSAGPGWAPTAKAKPPRRPGAHRAANRTTRKRATA